MRRFIGLLLVSVLITLCAGCLESGGGGDDSAGGQTGPTTSTVTLAFDVGSVVASNNADPESLIAKIIDFVTMAKACYAAYLYDYITALHIEVTGSGFPPIIHNEPITNPTSTFTVSLPVPNGPDRRFYIELRNDNGDVLYAGDLTIDVGNGGAPQDITVDVTIDENLALQDFIDMGRTHLEKQELEKAYDDFETVMNIQSDHPVASFFCGFTHFLLLIQKDDPDADAAKPNADLASVLSTYSNLPDIYLSTIAPDIYDNDEPGPGDDGYDDKVKDFHDNTWTEPTGVTSDSGVDLLENVLLPEIDNVISDLGKAEADPNFSTTITTSMHFGMDSTIKVDRGDVHVLRAIAYGLKANWNHQLAYNQRTNANYWYDELEKRDDDVEGNYPGLQTILDNDPGAPGEEVFDLIISGSGTYLTAAKNAYSKGLAKVKAGLQFMQNNRSDEDKEAENHIFNVADYNDNVSDSANKINIDKVVTNIDEAINSLGGETTITSYDDYDDKEYKTQGVSTKFDSMGVNLLELFSSPDRSNLPTFYYHSIGDTDVVILDTNDLPSSEDYIDGYNDVLTGIKRDGEPSKDFDDGTNDLEDLLSEEFLPDYYKFVVPVVPAGIDMNGNIADWSGVRPVALDRKDSDLSPNRDIVEVYMAKDATYLYVGLRFVGIPYTGTFATGDYLNYRIGFNCRDNDRGLHSVPVTVELNGTSDGWQWLLYNHGAWPPLNIPPAIMDSSDYAMGDMLTVRIPLSYIVIAIDANEPSEHFPTGSWDGKETHISVSLWSNIAAETPSYCYDEPGTPKLAELNI